MARNLSGLLRYNEVIMLLDVVSVNPKADFMLELIFANGEQRSFDMKPLLAIKPWIRVATPQVFNLARVDYGTVVWPGEIDIAPETLYDLSTPLR